jgi:DNA-binding GntR family transcriptional regulator
MILSGKLKKGQRLLRWKFVQIFDVSERTMTEAFSKLRKERLVTIKPGVGSVVA